MNTEENTRILKVDPKYQATNYKEKEHPFSKDGAENPKIPSNLKPILLKPTATPFNVCNENHEHMRVHLAMTCVAVRMRRTATAHARLIYTAVPTPALVLRSKGTEGLRAV